MLLAVLTVSAQVLPVGGCKAGLCEEGQGLPCARHSPLLPVPTDPPQDTVQPHGQDGASSVKMYLFKSIKMLHSRV